MKLQCCEQQIFYAFQLMKSETKYICSKSQTTSNFRYLIFFHSKIGRIFSNAQLKAVGVAEYFSDGNYCRRTQTSVFRFDSHLHTGAITSQVERLQASSIFDDIISDKRLLIQTICSLPFIIMAEMSVASHEIHEIGGV